MAIYSISDGMTRIDVPENHTKNNLEVGRVLHLNGYSCPDYVIVKKLNVESNYGATYLVVNPETLDQGKEQAYTLKYIAEKKDGRIQVYIMDEIKSADEVLTLWEQSEEKRKKREQAQEKAKIETDILIEKGKELYKKHIPENAKALIIACNEIDDCDLMTDYFNTTDGEMVILGWSKHKRDIFSEMRKHAGKIKETEHLATPPTVDRNGYERTEENKSWWHPSDEHREKYSMGAGYYLKAETRYSTGWKIYKSSYRMAVDEVYISLAKRCVL